MNDKSLCVILAAAAVFALLPPHPSPARAGDGVPACSQAPQGPPPFKKIRYMEDYSYLAAPGHERGVWERLKYVPVWEDEGWHVSLGGEARLRYEFFNNPGWGRGMEDGDGFLLQRYMLHADLRLGGYLRAFGQIKSGLVSGRTGGPGPNDKDELDLHQAFVDASVPLGPGRTLTVRAGRHEMAFGSSRLVSIRDRPNVRRSFDGFRASLLTNGWAVDGFLTKTVETDPGVFDDARERGVTFWGVYAVGPFPAPAGGKADLYYLGVGRDRAAFQQGAARETRHTLGARLWGPGGGGGGAGDWTWDYDVEFIYQTGGFGPGSISAWAVAADAGHTFADAPFRPRLGLKADAASGDRDPNDQDLETFNPMFPKGAYFSQAGLVGLMNLADLHPSLRLRLTEDISLTADWDFFWRVSRRDGLYSNGGALLRPGGTGLSRYVGSQPTVELEWRPSRFASLTVNYGHFFAGRFIRQSGPGKDVDYFGTWLTLTF